MLEELEEKYKHNFSNIYESKKYLLTQKEKFGIEFVSGKGKHKIPLQRDYETVKDCIEKAEKYSEYNNIFAGA